MYVYFVAMMCANRFGLGWAHDTFKFAYHMLMHSHAYVPSFILILILLVVFCVFLSLPLPFVSCSMAPKWKSTPSQNPLHSGASTSSNITPSHIQFCDDKAHKDFSKSFSRRGIHSKRQVILSDFSDTDLPTIIYSQGWESLCGISVTCSSVIIQEFYSNMHGFDTSLPLFVTRVRGMCIVVTPDIVVKTWIVSWIDFWFFCIVYRIILCIVRYTNT